MIHFFGLNILYVVQTGFTVWMLIDAYRRQADYVWFWVILLLPGLGAWVYFFAVKLGDFGWLKDLLLWQLRPSLAELRYRATHTPTLTSHLELAERLVERHDYAEAIPHLQAVLEQEPGLGKALYPLAVCHHEQGQSAQATALLAQLIARDPYWSNYAAWRLLIAIHRECEEDDQALTTSRELVRVSPTLQHRCLLAECLLAKKLNDEACKLLEQSLEDHRYAPGYVRRRNWRWAWRARSLRKQALSG
jgi:hypothetical protein